MESLNHIQGKISPPSNVAATISLPHAGVHSSANEIQLFQIEDRLKSLVFKPPSKDEQPKTAIDKGVEVINAKPDLISLVAEAVCLMPTSKACRSFGDKFDRLLSGILADLKEITEEPKSIQAKIAALLKQVKPIITSDFRISDRIDQGIFDAHPLQTPNALKDRACDALVESILEVYGHENAGETLRDRRNVKQSSWKAGYVPSSVKDLVKFRRTASDASLHGEDVRPILLRVKADIADQVNLETCKALRKYAASTDDLKPQAVVDTWRSHGKGPLPKVIAELIAILPSLNDAHDRSARASAIIPEITTIAETIEIPIKARQSAIKWVEACQEMKVRSERASSFLSSARNFLSRETLAESEVRELAKDGSKFGTEEEKNRFVSEALSPPNQSVLRSAVVEFINEEVKLLAKLIASGGSECVDHCLAIMPRVALGCLYLKPVNTEGQQSVYSLYRTPGFPGWIVGWYEFRKTEVPVPASAQNHSIADFARELVAFGRLDGNTVPLSSALKLEGLKFKRGLSLQEQQILDGKYLP